MSEEEEIVDPDSPVDDKELSEKLKEKLGVFRREEVEVIVVKDELEDETANDRTERRRVRALRKGRRRVTNDLYLANT